MKKVDQTALRFNQAMIVVLLAVAYLFDQVWLVAFVCGVMIAGTLLPKAGLFKIAYARLLKPVGLLKPNAIEDDLAPHLFAQGLGGVMLLAASLLLVTGFGALGWLLTAIVVALAAANLLLKFCLGCFIYYQLARRGIRPTLPAWRSV